MLTMKTLLPDILPPLADIRLSDISVNKRKRTMTVFTDGSARLSQDQVNWLSERLRERFLLNEVVIVLPKPPKDKDGHIESKLKEEQKSIIEALKRERKGVEKSDVIICKKIKGKLTPISEITPESGRVRTSGKIFSSEFKQLGGEAWVATLDITDHKASITCKLFFNLKSRQGQGFGRRDGVVKKEAAEQRLKNGVYIAVSGDVIYDKYLGDYVIMVSDINELTLPVRTDDAPEKRVELHLHTQMSAMDGVANVAEVIKRAAAWGHKAIAITDHGVVQAFPEAADAAKKYGIKVIYGVEAYVTDDTAPIVYNLKDGALSGAFVVFDLETTGLSAEHNHIIEIGAVKVKNGKIYDSFSTFVRPPFGIPSRITELTGITEAMVADAPPEDQAVEAFLEFIGDAVLVAHNASFDVGFLSMAMKRLRRRFDFCYLDTVELSRKLYPELPNHRLSTIAKYLNVKLVNHHRAVDDALAAANIFICMAEVLEKRGVKNLSEINCHFGGRIDVRGSAASHAIILVKNYVGLKNLYKLISQSHLNYFYRTPRMPKSLIEKHREGLIIGSACEQGEVYRGVFSGKTPEELRDIVSFYDYLEIQPLGNNEFLVRNGEVASAEQLADINRRIIDLGRQYDKPVVATGDVHFLDPHDEVFRRILMAGKGFSDADFQAPLFFRTTKEMLDEFSYLDKQTAYEVVVASPNAIADMVDVIQPTPDGKFVPEIDGAKEKIIRMANERASQIYGDPLPDVVRERMEKELYSITTYGFSVMYFIAQKLVSKSLADGYLVGSRGSVGSSFIAFLLGITEVNALIAHYVCPKCKHSEFMEDGCEICGCDLPDKLCPVCGEAMLKDGHNIPFETFLGFEGDKEPDIDLNFSGEYQSTAHKYAEELFGEGHVFRAGTIGTIAEKTAYGYVKKYFEERSLVAQNAEIKRLAMGCTGVKRTTGQHPGGIIIVPHHKDIHDFCPVQYPADDSGSNVITTHFDYHSIDKNLLKLDILGHDDPTVIRMLEDLTGVDAKTIPLDEKKTMSLFSGTEALGVTPEQIGSEVGTLGVPEFGTEFVRQMLSQTKPTTFSELLRISGLSHGTDVWLNNAQDYIKSGQITLKEAICTRDDIMIYLMNKGLPPKRAFLIMENVRKGKGLTFDDERMMKEHGVPEWYIDSCNKIKYMFPKAHATAYVMMAFRIAFYKVYYPEAFYVSYFTVRAEGNFDAELMCHGLEKVEEAMRHIASKTDATAKEKEVYTILEICREMYARGIKFKPVDLYLSDARKFILTPDGILPPLSAIQGVSVSAAQSIVSEREKGEFFSVEDLHMRTKISKTTLEVLRKNGCFLGLPESSQVTLFEMI